MSYDKKNIVAPEDCLVMISFNDRTAGPDAEKLANYLTSKGFPTFCTRLYCPNHPGSWRNATETGAVKCRYYIVLMTDGWQLSDECQIETSIIKNRLAKNNVTAIPVWYDSFDDEYDNRPRHFYRTLWNSMQSVFRGTGEEWMNTVLKLLPVKDVLPVKDELFPVKKDSPSHKDDFLPDEDFLPTLPLPGKDGTMDTNVGGVPSALLLPDEDFLPTLPLPGKDGTMDTNVFGVPSALLLPDEDFLPTLPLPGKDGTMALNPSLPQAVKMWFSNIGCGTKIRIFASVLLLLGVILGSVLLYFFVVQRFFVANTFTVAGYPDCHVTNPGLIGDGQCYNYEGYNTEVCGWDGGDCLVEGYSDCKGIDPSYIGNGVCNAPYNTTECGYDGGDCLP